MRVTGFEMCVLGNNGEYLTVFRLYFSSGHRLLLAYFKCFPRRAWVDAMASIRMKAKFRTNSSVYEMLIMSNMDYKPAFFTVLSIKFFF